MGGVLLVKAVERSHARLEFQSNAEYGRRFAALLESELVSGKAEAEVLTALQTTLAASPGDSSRYLCVLSREGEVLCHPKSGALGQMMTANFMSVGGAPSEVGPLSYREWVDQGQLEGFMVNNGEPVELIRRFPISSTGWQVLVHTSLKSLMRESRELSFTILSVMVPTGLFFILMGTLVVRWIGRNYELEIEEANQRLEERVNARTAELQHTVDELRKTRRALDLSEKMALLGQLVAGIAHEINNPLNVIGIQASNLREIAEDPDEQRAAEAIQRNANRCGQLVRNLLSFARNDPPRRQPTSLRELVETALALATGEAQRYQVVMDSSFPGGDVIVSADHIQLEQVLLNLVGNAAQALGGQDGQRKVTVTVTREGEDAMIVVEDNGPGLAPVIREHLFEPFQTTKDEGQGTGLGLSLCRRFVEGHGGRIEYRDRPEGGACFAIRLPIAMQSATSASL